MKGTMPYQQNCYHEVLCYIFSLIFTKHHYTGFDACTEYKYIHGLVASKQINTSEKLRM